jgi:hypothetical protein
VPADLPVLAGQRLKFVSLLFYWASEKPTSSAEVDYVDPGLQSALSTFRQVDTSAVLHLGVGTCHNLSQGIFDKCFPETLSPLALWHIVEGRSMRVTDDRIRTDGELLAEFASAGNEAAFAALVQRHGGMVQAACRRVLADHHEAQDVAQAVFPPGEVCLVVTLRNTSDKIIRLYEQKQQWARPELHVVIRDRKGPKSYSMILNRSAKGVIWVLRSLKPGESIPMELAGDRVVGEGRPGTRGVPKVGPLPAGDYEVTVELRLVDFATIREAIAQYAAEARAAAALGRDAVAVPTLPEQADVWSGQITSAPARFSVAGSVAATQAAEGGITQEKARRSPLEAVMAYFKDDPIREDEVESNPVAFTVKVAEPLERVLAQTDLVVVGKLGKLTPIEGTHQATGDIPVAQVLRVRPI